MNLFEYDKQENVSLLCGVDEAGRGPLAGDVYAAAVILPTDCFIEGLDDSKKLSPSKREIVFDEIVKVALAYSVGIATIAEIDELNILNATFLAMNRAVDGLQITPKMCLVDGNQNPKLAIHSRCLVKGDGTSACIAAASIIAKVSRDRYMEQLAKEYPEYQFEKHKGYGTTLHYKMLDEFGVSPVHRMSFLKKYLNGDQNKTQRRGQLGEQTTVEYLISQGYNILEKNYHEKYGEVDIIAIKADTIAFVEVKTRKANTNYVSAREAVSRSKQVKLIKTASIYMSKHELINNRKINIRFDVVEVYFQGEKDEHIIEINHIKNAFDGEGTNVFV